MDDIFSLADLRRIEHVAEVSGLDLMQSASQTAADWLKKHTTTDQAILCAAGVGNNGGDALWMAYHLVCAHYPVTIFMPELPKSNATQTALDACQQLGIPLITDMSHKTTRFAWVIDGLFGIGLNRLLSDAWQHIIRTINTLNCPILSLDVPSGLDAWRGTVYGEAIKATVTLTFLCAKPGLHMADGPDYAGVVLVKRLILPKSLSVKPAGTIRRPSAHLLVRKMNSHKGSYGTLCVVGGALGMRGAALLAGRAAVSTGAGKVYVALLEPDVALCDSLMPELMLRNANTAYQLGCDVDVIGPGFSTSNLAHQVFCELMKQSSAKVIDADALNLIANDAKLVQLIQQHMRPCILTPHPAEAARLLDISVKAVQEDRIKSAQTLARHFRATVVLKGSGTVIANADGFFRVNTTGNPALANAGQGDVLAGFCGALLAQGMAPFDAASLAVYIHGLVADTWRTQHKGTIGLTASNTILRLADALNRLIAKDHKR